MQISFSPADAKVGDARALASVIGEDELSPLDKKYLEFGTAFEETSWDKEQMKTELFRKL